ncbi:MAG: hypothetical protein GC161_13670 [Planctomycetaceae bacterium]|nr:hypothetical protein [Planctomycetaceae bacterium]
MRVPLSLCLPLSLALFTPTAGNSTWFAPETGLVLAKSTTGELRMELDSYEISVNGEPQDFEAPAMTIAIDFTHEWRDTYHAVSGGQPTDLERAYVTVKSTNATTQGDQERTAGRTSPLVGKKVRFTKEEEGDGFDSRFVDEEGDEELLEDLRVSVDFLGLLPEDDVEVGETWNGDLSRFDEIFSPLGELHTVMDDGTERPEDPWGELLDDALEAMEGDFEVTYTGNSEEGGRRLAEFAVRIEAEGSGEGEDSRMRDTPSGETESTIVRVATLGAELEAKLLWDLDAKHFVSCELEGAIAISHQEDESFDIGGQTIEIVTRRELTGTLESTTEAAAP